MIITGKAYWAKVLGSPQWGYKNQYKEWSIDIAIDDKTKQRLIAEGVSEDRFKNKDDDRGDFLTFKRREIKRDGEPAKPFFVVGPDKSPWPQDTMIGNGSKVNAKLILNESDDGLRPALLKLQIVDLVEYGDGEDFPAYDEDGKEEKWD